jgi:hypothetical protein
LRTQPERIMSLMWPDIQTLDLASHSALSLEARDIVVILQ